MIHDTIKQLIYAIDLLRRSAKNDAVFKSLMHLIMICNSYLSIRKSAVAMQLRPAKPSLA